VGSIVRRSFCGKMLCALVLSVAIALMLWHFAETNYFNGQCDTPLSFP
jgi:hypothetical protein